ncbi:MAG: hypothetical protein PHF45_01205 [Candidatus Pacebacteria bacterium]|nr:hypothetical protein [Candidatus Paceibacterota bacterium]
MLYNLFSKKSSGQVFLLSVLMLAAVMASALFLVTIFTKDLRRSVETSESIRAFYAADAAMEWQIYNSLNLNEQIEDPPQMEDKDKVYAEWQNDFQSARSIKTIGFSQGGQVSRGLEVYFGNINE